jgi:hypothetical protein
VETATDFCGNCGYYVGWDKTMAGVNPLQQQQPPPPVDPAVTPSLPPQEPRQPRQPDRPEPPPPPIAGPTVICRVCGDVNPDKRTYCQRCGERLPEPGAFNQPAALPLPQPYQPAPYPPQRPLNRTVLLALLAAVVLIIVGVLFAATRGGDSAKTSTSSSPTNGATTEPSGTQTTAPPATKIDPGTIDAEASSELPPAGGLTYGIGNTLDGNPSTAWNSNGNEVGTGAGQVLKYRFPDKVHLVRIDLVNGYAKSEKVFSQNGRIKAVAITTDAGTFEVTLADSKTPQNVQQDFGVTDSVSLRVISVYKGTKFPDLGLTEIAFQATPAG